MNEYVLHHITDLHAGASHYRHANRNPALANSREGGYYLDCYAEYLKRCDDRRFPTVIVVSGDITSRAEESEFELCKNFFEDVLQTVDKRITSHVVGPRLCIVPGNHDVDWANPRQELRLDRFRSLVERFGDRVLSPFSDEKPYYYYEDCNLLIYLFNSCSLGGVSDPEIEALVSEFERCEFGSNEPARVAFRAAIDKLEKRIKQDPGIVPVEELNSMVELPKEHDSMVKLAVVHHNPSIVPSLHVDQYDAMVNGGVFKERLARNGFDVVLHGHRHFQHCAYEEYLRPEKSNVNSMREGMYIVGAGTLGSSDKNEFFELTVSDAKFAHGVAPPSSIMKVLPMIANDANMTFEDGSNSYKLIIDKPVYSGLRHIQEALSRKVLSNKHQVRDALKQTLRPTIELKALVDDWQDGGWQVVFNDLLPSLSAIYGVDTLGPDGWILTRYLDYMLVQFQERLGRIEMRREATLAFSSEVFEAVSRTNWQPRSGATLIEASNKTSSCNSLEIARILIWKESWLDDKNLVRMIESIHQLASTPVFVLFAEHLEDEDLTEEFVIGIGSQDNDLCTYVFREDAAEQTHQITGNRKRSIRDRFRRLLMHKELRCLGEFTCDE
ncbi:metallophosphoesterase family protein [Thalassoglobus sp.]|uniref:metallophosphoesterase family protein n=1 Tax=Thalassoglobus sp. TaxID=2795869 RepID=UPI003AA83F0B